jgi:isocitrate lyase
MMKDAHRQPGGADGPRGLEAIYCSGWQVAADANTSAQTYPDQSLYPADSVPKLVKRINRAAARRPDRLGRGRAAPRLVRADRRGRGGRLRRPLNAYELMKGMIEAGAAGVHFEDQLASEKKCGHLGGKVLVPTAQFEKTLIAARLAADVCGTPTVLVARTDAESAKLLTSDIDERDQPFSHGPAHGRGLLLREAGPRELHRARPSRTRSTPTSSGWRPRRRTSRRQEVRRGRAASTTRTRCSPTTARPSFNWKKNLDDATIAKFQRELGAMGYKFQFVTLAGFHMLNYACSMLASDYKERGMAAYSELQQAEFAAEKQGYTATKHQREVGTGYFDGPAELHCRADLPK